MKDVKDTDYSKWTREDFIFHHRKMWNWITNKTLKLKRKVIEEEYFETMGISEYEIPINTSYCCAYDMKCMENSNYIIALRCENCPIDWNSSMKKHMCQNMNVEYDCEGLYLKYYRCDIDNYKEAARLASKIASLPEVENV